MHESSPAPVSLSALFELVGGSETCQRLSDRFHERVAEDAVLSQMFPKNMTPLNERFALFVGERLGGPASYTAKRGKQSLTCRHAHLSISTEEANRWLAHMFAAMADVGIAEPAGARLRKFFVETARTLTDPFLPLYRLPLDELRTRIEADSQLLGQSPMGHSLLREAVCRWDAPRVRLLLESGANVDAEEPLGHGLLYRAANSDVPGSEKEGKDVVELLIQHGSAVNRQSGPGKSTPLHMAARRGHVFLADILLKAGADMEAKDSKGETPLRRAVNCQREQMVLFLLSRGANPFSRDKNGRTPEEGARRETIRVALRHAVGRK
jgi:hemoglobin